MKVGIQTNAWDSSWHQNNLAGLLKEVKLAGYDGIEIGMQRVDLNHPKLFKQVMSDAGLVLAGLHTHLRWEDKVWRQDAAEKMQLAADFCAELGAPYMPISGSRIDKTQEELAEIVKLLNSYGEMAAANDIRFCYHHHDWELANEWGEMRYLMEKTDPDKVGLLMDIGWVSVAEQSVKRFLRLFGERLCYIHAKDHFADKEWTELGKGVVDFVDLFERLPANGRDWIVVERDAPMPNALESSRISRDYLRSIHNI